MGKLIIDQVNLVATDVEGAADFLRALDVDVPELDGEWAAWAPHHVGVPAADRGFGIDLDSTEFAAHWGGLPDGFTGVVLNLRTEDRDAVDTTFDRAVALGADALKPPYDAFWGARYAVVGAPGPLMVGIMSRIDDQHRSQSPAISDFA